MGWFGIGHVWEQNVITIQPGTYSPRDFSVEGDWSAASYYYSMAAFVPEAHIEIHGLNEQSLQGDAVVKEIYEHFGVKTEFNEKGISITNNLHAPRPMEVRYDFTNNPDLAQTLMVTVAGLGVKGIFTGLKTLRLKETDRIAAMQTELAKVKTTLTLIGEKDDVGCTISGKAKWKDKAKFDTYEDHRMAMSLTPLACIHPVVIRNPDVVTKSYPGFWKDIEAIGLQIERKGKH